VVVAAVFMEIMVLQALVEYLLVLQLVVLVVGEIKAYHE
jgi:hypothetical protein